MNGPIDIHGKIRLYKHQLSIVLANASDIGIATLQYSTYSTQLIDDEGGIVIMSSRPHYSIENIPAHTYLELEKMDEYEDGVKYVLEKVVWDDGKVYEKEGIVRVVDLSNFVMAFSNPFVNMAKISRDKTLIGSVEGCEKRL